MKSYQLNTRNSYTQLLSVHSKIYVLFLIFVNSKKSFSDQTAVDLHGSATDGAIANTLDDFNVKILVIT